MLGAYANITGVTSSSLDSREHLFFGHWKLCSWCALMSSSEFMGALDLNFNNHCFPFKQPSPAMWKKICYQKIDHLYQMNEHLPGSLEATEKLGMDV